MEKIDVTEKTIQDLKTLRDMITQQSGKPSNYDTAIQFLIFTYNLVVESLPVDFLGNVVESQLRNTNN
jgi:hypothetical protein